MATREISRDSENSGGAAYTRNEKRLIALAWDSRLYNCATHGTALAATLATENRYQSLTFLVDGYSSRLPKGVLLCWLSSLLSWCA